MTTGIHWLGTTGPFAHELLAGAQEAGSIAGVAVEDALELVGTLTDVLTPEHWLLLKGSRGQRLERLLEPLGLSPSGGKA